MEIKYFFITFLFTLLLPVTGIQADEFEDLFRRAEDAVFNQQEQPEEVYNLLDAGRRNVHQMPRQQDKFYWLARLEYLEGYMDLLTREEPKDAEKRFKKSEELVEQALSYGEFSDGYSLLSDIIGRLCQIKGKPYAIRKGRNVEKYASRALELDPYNSRALLMLGSAKVFTPKIFGGDPIKGIGIMLDALRQEVTGKDNLFRLYAGLGTAYNIIGNLDQAKMHFGESLRVFPGNQYANRELANL